MPTTQSSLPLQKPAHWYPLPDSLQTQFLPSNDTGRIVFTRQLWQRKMPEENQTDQSVLNKSYIANSQANQNNPPSSSRRTSSTISLRSRNRSPSPARGSKTPLTPEESPPFKSTRKRSSGTVEQEEKYLNSTDTSPAHTRANSGDSAVHVCICQPDPKIPRPRNAFILYRQHHQANVVAQNPGLANPEISKIIGEQWQNQPQEVKSKWKALAEEEKLRHQQQYPTYRYQPKRNGRRNSLTSDQPGSAGEKHKCQKCGGRTILTPSAPFPAATTSSVPPTPSSAATPVTRTLPIFRDLTLQSPGACRMPRHQLSNMSPNQHSYADERDDLGSLSPENKRRRFNGDHGTTVNRVNPPRYGAAPPGAVVGPGTPFPFGQGPPPPHPYPPAIAAVRRESLPGLRGVVSPPGPMAPPPRPGMGYQQHRLSQGHLTHDRSLTLPPLQTAHQGSSTGTAGGGKTAEEQIMSIGFRYKIKVLSQVAPPAPKSNEAPRGPLIAVEGDNAEAARELAEWLKNTLSSSEGLCGNLFDGPELPASGSKEEVMAQYHRLAADWLGKSKGIRESIAMKVAPKLAIDAAMPDVVSSQSPQSSRKVDENYDDESSSQENMQENEVADKDVDQRSKSDAAENMDIDKGSVAAAEQDVPRVDTTKPISIIPNYSLHTSNSVACLIPLGTCDPYSPNDHWQWTATQWRGIIGPDLTIYVRGAVAGESGRPSVEIEGVDGRPDVGLFVVRRTKNEGQEGVIEARDAGVQVEASVLRRVGFEVSEWVRAFRTDTGKD